MSSQNLISHTVTGGVSCTLQYQWIWDWW